METAKEAQYWSNRYKTKAMGWDIGAVSTPLKGYIDQLTDQSIHILIPGAGNAYEAEYLYHMGFTNTYVMDIAKEPLDAFAERNPDFPADQLLCENFFDHEGTYDLILEQTFFCSFPPTRANRSGYARQMASLLKENGKLVGLWFKHPLIPGDMEKRPFGGTKEEYVSYLIPYFDIQVLQDSYNSIAERMGNELFGIMKKK